MENRPQTAATDGLETGTGILPLQMLEAEMGRQVFTDEALDEGQVQPSSIDLRLGAIAYRVPASFLPGPNGDVEARVAEMALERIDLGDGAVLQRGSIYIVPLLESLKLRRRHSAIANPKSSTGRLDIFVRLIGNGVREFDRLPEQYTGPLFAEISPRSFHVRVRTGSRLLQLRIRRGRPSLSLSAMREMHERYGIIALDGSNGQPELDDVFDIKGGARLSIDTQSKDASGICGYRAHRDCDALIDLEKVGALDPQEYFEPIHADRNGRIMLEPDDFYILVSRELVSVPPDVAAEMIAYDTFVGEFRVHYAGFFDPGFGYFGDSSGGTPAVLEVRSHEVPFLLDHGQTVGSLLYHKLAAVPTQIYGAGIGSNYARQGLTLSKHFKRPAEGQG